MDRALKLVSEDAPTVIATAGNTLTVNSNYMVNGGLSPITGCVNIDPSSWSYYYYPTIGPDKVTQAYKVIRALMEAKVLKIATLPAFFRAMDEIVKVI